MPSQGKHFINSFPLTVSISVSKRKLSAIATQSNRIVSNSIDIHNPPVGQLDPHCSRRSRRSLHRCTST